MESITFPVAQFKNMTTEGIPPRIRKYFYVEIHDIPRMFADYCSPDQDPRGPEYEQTVSVMQLQPQKLHLLMRPITMHASHIAFDNRKGKVSISLEKNGVDGVCVGSEILDAVLTHRDDPDLNREMYVEFEVLSGFTQEELDELKQQRKLS